MRKSRFTEEQIIGILQEAEAGASGRGAESAEVAATPPDARVPVVPLCEDAAESREPPTLPRPRPRLRFRGWRRRLDEFDGQFWFRRRAWVG